ncbi:hypothetical protein H5410_003560 [Solanum commersonii]|uniref:Uncharacterized protein n=1 Tax=Solanum commersonii TaxID=4109 RepID=A0A9J6B5F5_SOLCO|nr:hypothetical protein H5410_003560 [Solanum commersonii]
MESFFVQGQLDIFVELELAQVASISPKQHELPIVPVCKALKEVDEKVRKEHGRSQPHQFRGNKIASPNNPECKDAKGKTLKAMR